MAGTRPSGVVGCVILYGIEGLVLSLPVVGANVVAVGDYAVVARVEFGNVGIDTFAREYLLPGPRMARLEFSVGLQHGKVRGRKPT